MAHSTHMYRLCVLTLSSIALFAVAGCASQDGIDHRKTELTGDAIDAAVPQSAALIEAGHKRVTAVAPGAGQLYLFDTNTEKLLYTTHVDQGQTITLDAANDRIAVDGLVVNQQPLVKRHVYQMYFDRGATAPVQPVLQTAQATNR